MRVVNASHWRESQQGDRVLYSVHPAPPRDAEACRRDYRAFAWLQLDKNGTLLAGRDHFGLEPFYYCYRAPDFIFGSTIPDILRHLPERPAWSESCKIECFSQHLYGIPPYSALTFYEGIYRLSPGHILHFDAGRFEEKPFWRLDPTLPLDECVSEKAVSARFSALLEEALLFHVQDGSEIAAELSGGLDSTSVFVTGERLGLQPYCLTHAPRELSQWTEEATAGPPHEEFA